MPNIKTGIASIGLHFPPLVMSLSELATLRGVEPLKYLEGLGCQNMALCPKDYNVVVMATEAAKRALARWGGDKSRIGLIIVGTECAPDMSRPLSAWVAEKLGLKGALRSYEVKHACYGGTLALRQAVEWKLSGVHPNKAALVIAVDIALYAPGDPGEPTQGAGAVAMVIDEPLIAEIEGTSFPFSMPAFDFWHPLDKAFPMVDGQFSLECYKRAARDCFQAMIHDKMLEEVLAQYRACCFHTPFPKMVKKSFFDICEFYGISSENAEKLFAQKVEPTMSWNKQCGNAYTASLWIAVANALRGMNTGEKLIAFSYGSGCGAELQILQAGPLAKVGAWEEDVKHDFAVRKKIDGKTYQQLREENLLAY